MATIHTKRTLANNNNPGDPNSTIIKEDIEFLNDDVAALNVEVMAATAAIAAGPTDPFTYNAAGSTLGSGIIAYTGGYLADGTLLPSTTKTVTGVVDQYIWITAAGAVATGPTPPTGVYRFLKVPYSGGTWQTPVDVRPSGAVGGGGTLQVASFTATALQTAFTLSWAPASIGEIVAFLDGTQIVSGYALSVSGATLTASPGIPLNGKLTVIGASGVGSRTDLSGSMTHPTLIGTGNAVTTDFLLPTAADEEIVWAGSGALQIRGTDYTIVTVGATKYVRFTTAPATGLLIHASSAITLMPTADASTLQNHAAAYFATAAAVAAAQADATAALANAAAALAAAGAAGNPAAANWANWDGIRDRTVSDMSSAIGANITASAPFWPVMAALDATRVLIIYYDVTAAAAKAVVATIGNSSVTYGAVTAAATPIGAGLNLKCVKIATDKVLVTYSLVSGGSIWAVVFTAAGDTISYGTAVNTGAYGTTAHEICEIATDKAVRLMYDTSPALSIMVISVSGTTITLGTSVAVGGGNWNLANRITKLDTDKFCLLAGVNSASTTYTYVGSVSATTITMGGALQVKNISPTDNENAFLVAFSPTQYIAGFNNGTGMQIAEISVSGVTASLALASVADGFLSSIKRGLSIVATGTTTAIMTGCITQTNFDVFSAVLMQVDTPAAPNTPVASTWVMSNAVNVYNPSTAYRNQLIWLSSSRLLALYMVGANSSIGSLYPKLRLIQL